MKRNPAPRRSRLLRRLTAFVLLPALIAFAVQVMAAPVLANTSQGAPVELACTPSGTPGASISCTIRIDNLPQQGGPITVTPIQPAGTLITGCTATDPRFVATGPGGTLPTYVPVSGASAGTTTQAAIGTSITVPANTCALTQTQPGNVAAGSLIGSETLTLGGQITCGGDITRQIGRSYQGNGTIGLAGGLPVTDTEEGFEDNVSGGVFCGGSVTNTVLPGQKSCTFAGTTATCSVNNDVFLVTGSTLIVSPASSAGGTITGCTALAAGVVATPAGGTLPTVTLTPTFGGGPFPSQTSLNGNTVVPANTCAFTVTAPTPPAAQAGTTMGTETVTFGAAPPCGNEFTQQMADFIPNGTGIVTSPAVTYPNSASGTVSGGFFCGVGPSAPSSGMTTTGVPAQTSCPGSGAGGTTTCTVTNNVYVMTGDTLLVQFLTPGGVVVTGCSAPDPRVIASGPGAALPVFNQQGGALTTSGTLQTAILDANGNATGNVPANSCAFTYTGTTPPGFQAGTTIGLITAGIPGGASQGTEATQRVTLFAATTPATVQFGFGAIAGSGGNNLEFVTAQFAGTISAGLLGPAVAQQSGTGVVLATGPLGSVLITGCGNVDVLSSPPSASGVPAPNSILSTVGVIPAGEGPGTTLYLLAIPCPGGVFSGWSGGPCDGTATNPCELTILSGVIPSITAKFIP